FSEPRRGSYLRGCFTALVSLLLLLVVVGGFLGWWAFWRPRPQVNGSIRVAGLQAPVEVLRDEWGVPHIYAQNEHDLFFAQGYVHAQDRLWQMDLQRRIGMARLSEIFGEDGLETDRFLRTIGTNRAARADVANLDPQSLAILEAYAAGVNAFLESHRSNLPIEFRILRYSPELWQPADTAAWAKMMQWSLSSNWEDELFRARLVAELGEPQAADLMALYPEGAPLILPEGVDTYSRLGAPRVAAARMLGDLGFGSGDSLGSNNWVVSGAKSTTGRPILANDPHLGIRMPSIWYEIGLHAPGLNAVGASLPGIPALVIGHNDHIAWGMTTLQVDVQDLYIERLNPDNPAEYEVDGRFEPFDIVREEIHVSGRAEPEILEVRVGRHGPLINDVLEGAERPTAFRWLAVAEPSTLLATIGPLIRASTWEEFTAALETWDAPGQNFVYADDQGNIGYYGAARVPIRAQGTGDVPAPGWDGSHDWEGFIPFEEMPHAFNPPEGFIATANNKPVPDDYPFHLGSAWAAPYRQQRIVTLLTAKDKLSLEDMRAIQADIVSLPARTLVPALLSVACEDIIVQRA
ncbi:MAG TPA: penicillin acylase family protein, partial [Ardenticatenaceae bacterium]|nr:penicillin acylase family protein [Ardenticatenaceae bacterium]